MTGSKTALRNCVSIDGESRAATTPLKIVVKVQIISTLTSLPLTF